MSVPRLFALLPVATLLIVSAADAQDTSGWGAIRGQVLLADDKLPVPDSLAESVKKSNDAKHCMEKGPIFREEWVVNAKNKGVANVFIWLGPPDPKKRTPLPIHPRLQKIEQLEVEIDQPCCKFVPHVVALREGQVLIAKNSAPVAHNFHYTGNPDVNPGENPLIAPKGKHVIKGLRADRTPISVKCSFHPWMTAWIRVFNHPYFTVTDENGGFEIKDAPAGEFRLHLWHEGAGWGDVGRDGQSIIIRPGQAVEHKLTVRVPKL